MEGEITHEIVEQNRLKIAKNMRIFGGSFVQALSECVVYADSINLGKLVDAFPHFFKVYLYQFDEGENNVGISSQSLGEQNEA